MTHELIKTGYLDVKISAKVKRGFTPWKAWKKQWCEIKEIDNIVNGIEIKFKNSPDSNVANFFIIPKNATLCRTESRTKQYCFGIFGADRCHKPLAFLSGSSESDSQLWMYSIRKMLSLNSQILDENTGFYVSIVDNDHSRIAGLTGLHGYLTTNLHEVLIKNPSTEEIRTTFSWHHLHQFHLAATNLPEDEKKIVVIHTSKHFRSGPGQLHLFCVKAPSLLNCLVSRGKVPRIRLHSFLDSRRMSRSEGDLREDIMAITSPESSSPSYYNHRSHCGSDDSGVRVSLASDDSNLVLKCKKAVSFLSLGFGLLVATPGGSEIDNESCHDLLLENEEEIIFTDSMRRNIDDPRRESGVSILSGVYEEILDIPPPKEFQNSDSKIIHTYEDPVDVILKSNTKFTPPPLPPRKIGRQGSSSDEELDLCSFKSKESFESLTTIMAHEADSDYMVMTPAITENVYTPMTSNLLSNSIDDENQYMVMNGKISS